MADPSSQQEEHSDLVGGFMRLSLRKNNLKKEVALEEGQEKRKPKPIYLL